MCDPTGHMNDEEEMSQQRDYCIAALIGFAFALFRFGWDVLNPLNIEWMMHMSDHAAHFLAWHFFRQEPWAFPLGLIRDYLYPMGTSIAFNDAIPIMALLFRLFSDALPQHVQYYGFWMFLSHALHMVFALMLMRVLLPGRVIIQWLGALLLLINPVMMARVEHVGLASHWLLLWALWLYCSAAKDFQFKKYACGWWSLVLLSAWVTPYLFTMSFCFALVSWVRELVVSRALKIREFLVVVGVTIGLILITFWLQGYFHFRSMTFDAFGYGHFSLNLLAPFNPMGTSRWLPNLAHYYVDQGYGYLGLGGLLLGAGCLVLWFVRFAQQKTSRFGAVVRHWPLLVFVVLTAVFSLSQQITLGDQVVLRLPIEEGDFLHRLGSMFRATERFIWIFHYVFFTAGAVYLVTRLPQKVAPVVLGLLLLIQAADLTHYQNIPRDRHEARLNNPLWPELIKGFDVIVPMPPFQRHTLHYDDFKDFGLLAGDAQKKLAAGYVSRRPKHQINIEADRLVKEIRAHQPDPRTLYVFSQVSSVPFRRDIDAAFSCIPLDDYLACFDKKIDLNQRIK